MHACRDAFRHRNSPLHQADEADEAVDINEAKEKKFSKHSKYIYIYSSCNTILFFHETDEAQGESSAVVITEISRMF